MRSDVVVVGASVAGCTAAMLYGRAGLTVTVVEKARDASAFKGLCGHFVLGGTAAMLRRTGLWDRMVAAGAVAGGIERWTGTGWSVPPADAPEAISLRRERLDPLLRSVAAGTPGVEIVYGAAVEGLLTEGGRVTGVRTRDGREFRGRLVVGADGYRSTVAGLADAKTDTAPNNRFGMWAYYRGLSRASNRIWMLEPDVAITIRTDDDLTMLVAFPDKARLPAFRADRAGALESFVAALPDGPDLAGASRVSPVIGMTDYPCVRRDPTPAPGLVLVGDAALAGDPQPAVGCGWAFRAAEWLVLETAPALRGGGGGGGGDGDGDGGGGGGGGGDRTGRPAPALRVRGDPAERRALAAYRRRLKFIVAHDRLARKGALANPPDAVQRLLFRAATRDPAVAARLYLLSMRAVPVSAVANPWFLAQAALRAGVR
ncbi:NAD(P)/FAD-dependent oxidoreductase [Virgisporangium aurantiacum]|uniref:FAD-dependent oxidoreductase n=1 Tax=Virgisporangium aurantiacum TaxID=175570 RepID=A0A8J3ZCU3_9ACTN|nr:NAD(P)/FAD-dependent oxidoreductase [Virgisporangium aurantiacum]GIJ59271.1 FAD-dependent oxidoreductase [Virgisporangium aurantiacum]